MSHPKLLTTPEPHSSSLSILAKENITRQLEELIVRRAFNYCGNNQVQTARLLGTSRNILRTQLKHFGLISPESIPSDTEPFGVAVSL